MGYIPPVAPTLARLDKLTATLVDDPDSDTRASLSSTIAASVPTAPVDLATFGDSLTASGQGGGIRWPQLVSDYLGLSLYNPSVAGEAPSDIATRQGGLAPRVTAAGSAIPAAVTPVEVTSISPSLGWRSGTGIAAIGTFKGRLCGVSGTLKHDQGTGAWTFTRDVAGDAVECPAASRFRVDASKAARGAIQTFWAGHNYPDVASVTARTAEMIEYLAAGNDRFIVLSVLNTSAETAGTAGYNTIIAINDALAGAYPSNYLDIRAHLIANGLQEEGIAATAQDTADIANDVVPVSLRADSTHLNAAGIRVVARAVALFIANKGTWVDDSGVFIPAPAFDPTAKTWLALPTANSSQANTPAPTAVSSVSADFSWEVVFTPRAAVPAGPIGLLDRQTGGTSNSAWQIYLYGSGNMRLQVLTNAGTSDFRDSTGGTPFTPGTKTAIRIDYQASSNTLAMYRGSVDPGTGVVSWGAAFYTANMNASTNNTTAAAPVRLRGAAVDVDRVTIRNFARDTVLMDEDFTDGDATGWTLASGAALESAPWAYA